MKSSSEIYHPFSYVLPSKSSPKEDIKNNLIASWINQIHDDRLSKSSFFGTHSKISPSTLSRVLLCPASVRLCNNERCLPDEENKFSQEGSLLHLAISHILLRLQHSHPKDIIYTLPRIYEEIEDSLVSFYNDKYYFYPAEEGRELLFDYQSSSSFFIYRLKNALEQLFSIFTPINEAYFSEHPVVVLENLNIRGTVDLWWADSKGEIHILDFKFGKTPVEVADNPQLQAYALGVINLLNKKSQYFNSKGESVTFIFDLNTKIHMHIIQPAVSSFPSTHSSTVQRITEWHDAEVTPTVTEALTNPICKAAPSEKACRYCRAQSICEERKKYCVSKARRVFKLDVSGILEESEIFAVYEYLHELESYSKQISSYVHKALSSGPKFGYELKPKRGKYIWDPNKMEFLNSVLEKMKKEDPCFNFYESSILSPNKLFKAYPGLKSNKDLSNATIFKISENFNIVKS